MRLTIPRVTASEPGPRGPGGLRSAAPYRAASVVLVFVALALSTSGFAGASSGDEDDDRQPLVRVPPGCVAPPLPDIVFVGTVVDRDFRTARFLVEHVRAGDATPFTTEGLIDVRYGLDVQYLQRGQPYLVAASRDPLIGVLASRIREPTPEFGGDAIVGLAESDLDCPEFEDPLRTLHPDGRAVSTSVLAPMVEDRRVLLGVVLIPVAVSFGVIFLLAMLRLGISGVIRGVRRSAARR